MDINILKNFYDIPDNANEFVLYSKKINVIKNGHFAYSTYIKSKRPITKKQVKNFLDSAGWQDSENVISILRRNL